MVSVRPAQRVLNRAGARLRIAVAMLAVGAWLVSGQAAPAQTPAGTSKVESASKSYILPYAVVILSIGLGLTVVCYREDRADKEAKPKKDSQE